MKSRKNGDIMEHVFANYAKSKYDPIDEYTITKTKSLYNKYHVESESLIKLMNNKIDDALKDITNDKLTQYILMKDIAGSKGDSSDIKFKSANGKFVNISCKRNNTSIKHQRCNSLHKQLDLNEDDTKSFIEKYNTLNKKWYDKLENNLHFNEMTNKSKMDLYKEFNELIASYIKKNDIKKFVEFLTSKGENKFIAHWNDKTNRLKIYTCKDIVAKLKDIAVDNNYITIKLDNDVNILMRLHTASKRITKTLSLKYDTHIENIDNIYSYKDY